MKKPAFRCPNPSVFIFGLLLISAVGAAAAAENPRPNLQAREDFRAAASSQAKSCPSCALVHQKCFGTCFADVEKEQIGSCLTACNNAAALCTCDEEVTLRSEDLVELGLVSINKNACHGYVSCQPNYPSCAGWSDYSTCGEPYCQDQFGCGECNCDEFGICYCGRGPARFVPYERFRVCFDQFGNSCTEWYPRTIYNCGC